MKIGVVAGSGLDLSPLLDHVDNRTSFAEIHDLPTSSVAGHTGEFVEGRCGDNPLVIQAGRLHLYEGHDPVTVARTVDVLAKFGVSAVVFTSAAGGLREDMEPGYLMAAERITLWPCARWLGAPKRIEPGVVIDGCDGTGMYHWIHGPAYETRAEIAALQSRGADAVGMSVAPEMHRAHALGLRTAAIACVTNNCCRPNTLTHAHVIKTAREASGKLCEVLRVGLPKLAQV